MRRRWGEQQRRRYNLHFAETMANLVEYPELGQPRDDLFPGCRQLRVEQHILFYRLTEEEIIVGRVLHVRQEAAGRVIP